MPPGGTRDESRTLALALAASLVLHGAALWLGPAPGGRAEAPFEPPRVLAVVLPEPAPPAPRGIPAPPPPPPSPPRAKPKAVAPPPPKEQRRPAEERSLLTVPAPPAETPSVAPPGAAPAASQAQAPAAGGTAGSGTVHGETLTPPSFRAAYLQNPPPRYPLSARRNGEEGTVLLRVLVTPEGRPGKVELERSSGSAVLDGAALEAVEHWRFVPARRGSEPVEAWVRVPLVFRLEAAN